MGNLILFMHISLDGFAARKNGEMDWIHVDDEIFAHGGERIYETNIALYGRKTFQLMEGYWPTAADQPNPSKHDLEHSRWYKQAKKVVLSRTMKNDGQTYAQVIGENLVEEIQKVKQSTDKEILLFGSPTAAHALVAADLVDGYWFNVNPILLGEGIPVFEERQTLTPLTLVSTKVFSSGVVCLNYIRKI